MNFASQFCYVPDIDQAQIQQKEVYTDSNIVIISFSFLKQIQNFSLGDPLLCEQCKAVFNYYSKLYDSKQYDFFLNQRIDYMIKKKKNQDQQKKAFTNLNKNNLEEIEKNPAVKLENKNERVWICEFCGYHNKINIDLTEIPESNDQFFLLNNFQKKQSESKNNEETIIFCVDNRQFLTSLISISGSMCSAVEIQSQQKSDQLYSGLTKEEYELLKQFIEPGSEDQARLMFQKPNVQFISRKQCLVNAVEEQLIQMKSENLATKVGLVSFNNEVEVVGDGMQLSKIFAGDKLSSKQQLLECCSGTLNQMIQFPIQKTTEKIIKVLEQSKEQGQTALGPALFCSLEMLKEHKPGSMIILCTDGLANIGLGNLDVKNQEEIKKAQNFYEELALVAKERGIIISLMTIKGESSKLDILKRITSITNGNIKIVDPQNLSKGFGKILADKLVGFNAEIEIVLHQTAKFRNEVENQNSNQNILKKQFGNVSLDTKFSFEYNIENIAHIDLYKLNQLPYQIKVFYTNENGEQFMKVQTKILEITRDKNIAEDNCDPKLIEIRMGQVNAQYYAASM